MIKKINSLIILIAFLFLWWIHHIFSIFFIYKYYNFINTIITNLQIQLGIKKTPQISLTNLQI